MWDLPVVVGRLNSEPSRSGVAKTRTGEGGLKRIWSSLRRVVPVSWYPLLATPFRLDAGRRVRRLEAAEAGRDIPHDVPPPVMRIRVTHRGHDVGGFIKGGEESRRALEAGLAAAGRSLGDFGSALDFGCGSGRTLRAFRDRPAGLRLTGTDVDLEAVAWCRDHLDFAEFAVNSALPPLECPDDAFDLAWAISVFTHLDESYQFAWLEELARVLRPGGILLATIHGEHVWRGLPPWTVRRIRDRGFAFARTGAFAGVLPDWYQMTWHSAAYVAREWSKWFQVVDHIEQGAMHGFQDLIVLRRP